MIMDFTINPQQQLSTEAKLWVSACMTAPVSVFEPLPEHADTRSYFRFSCDGQTWILMVANKDQAIMHDYVKICRAQKQAGLPVADVAHVKIQQDCTWVILEDLGAQTLLDYWQSQPSAIEQKQQVWLQVQDLIQAYQSCAWPGAIHLPVYSAEKARSQVESGLRDFAASMEIRPNWPLLKPALNQWMAAWAGYRQACTHVDFHSANILCSERGSQAPGCLGVVDVQDVCLAPWVYDWVSFIDDHYIRYEPSLYQHWSRCFYHKSQRWAPCTQTVFFEALRVVSIQRHIKNLGVFTRLLVKGKSQYRKAIPGMLKRLLEHMSAGVKAGHQEEKAWLETVVALEKRWLAGQQATVSS